MRLRCTAPGGNANKARTRAHSLCAAVVCACSFPGLLAEMLSSATNQIGFSWAAAPVATELEAVMMDWLGELVGMPTKFLNSGGTGGGVIQGTSSEAVLVALLAARARSLRGAESSTALRLCAYASDQARRALCQCLPSADVYGARPYPAQHPFDCPQAHSCFKKACMIAGITNVRLLPTRPDDAYALQVRRENSHAMHMVFAALSHA